MTSAELLVDAFGRIKEAVHFRATCKQSLAAHHAVAGLTTEQLAFRPDNQANSIAWLVWHLTRVQDDHVADAAGVAQVWTAQGWAERFGLPFDAAETGYGQRPREVAALAAVSRKLLLGYHDAVFDVTVGFVSGLADADLPRVVDPSFDPPVTLAVRLVSVIADDLMHVGQAAYVRGLATRR